MPSWTWEPQQESSRFGDIELAFHWCLSAICGSLPAMGQRWLEGVLTALPERDRILHLVQIEFRRTDH